MPKIPEERFGHLRQKRKALPNRRQGRIQPAFQNPERGFWRTTIFRKKTRPGLKRFQKSYPVDPVNPVQCFPFGTDFCHSHFPKTRAILEELEFWNKKRRSRAFPKWANHLNSQCANDLQR
jgi:hypothetical protein